MHHDTTLTHRMDHVVPEDIQRCVPELSMADPETMWILGDISPTPFQFFTEAGPCVSGIPLKKTLRFNCVLSSRCCYMEAKAHFPRSFFR
jgi:hypothetical protein